VPKSTKGLRSESDELLLGGMQMLEFYYYRDYSITLRIEAAS